MDKNRKSVKNMFLNCKGKHIKVYVYINRKLIKIFVILIKKIFLLYFTKKNFSVLVILNQKVKKHVTIIRPVVLILSRISQKLIHSLFFFFRKKHMFQKIVFFPDLTHIHITF